MHVHCDKKGRYRVSGPDKRVAKLIPNSVDGTTTIDTKDS